MTAACPRHDFHCSWNQRQHAACIYLQIHGSRASLVRCQAKPAGNVSRRTGGKAASIPAPIEGGHTPASLAFLGDAIWTLHVRVKHLLPRKHVKTYRALSDEQVTAEHQAQQCQRLLQAVDDPGAATALLFSLTPQELALVHWAMAEQPAAVRQRFRGKPDKLQQYQLATAFEALVGYLHLTNPARCQLLLGILLQSQDSDMDG